MHPSAVGQFAEIDRVYLDSASYGRPPVATVDAMRAALDTWSAGTADWIADWDPSGERCRALIAPMIGAAAAEIALVPAVSVAAAIVLTSLSPGAEIVVPEDEFASVLLPSLVAAEQRGARVRRVPFASLADALTADTELVVTSHVRSNDGRVQDLATLGAAARAVCARVLLDATHSAGVLPIEAERLGIDFVACAAYKHLLCPRGVAFLRVPAGLTDRVVSIAASWRSTSPPWTYFGANLDDLPGSAARYDVSLAWHPWVGAQASLAFLATVPADERRDWCVGQADELAAQLGLAPTGSSILAVTLREGSGESARAALRAAGIVGSGRDERIRLSFHLYNDLRDVEAAAQVLHRFVDVA